MVWILGALTAVLLGVAFLVGAVRRGRLAPLQEGASGRTIADLEPGRFRVTGRIVPMATSVSEVDGSPCVFLERAHYQTFGSSLVPVLRERDRELVAHPFFLEDASGRVLVDPKDAHVEAVTLDGDDGLLAERRLRAGEEVEVIARFERRVSHELGEEGAYRAGDTVWTAREDEHGPPRITYRIDPEMTRAVDDVAILLRGAGAIMLMCAVLLTVMGVYVSTPALGMGRFARTTISQAP